MNSNEIRRRLTTPVDPATIDVKQLYAGIQKNYDELYWQVMDLRSYARYKDYEADMIDTLDDCLKWLRVTSACAYEVSNDLHPEESDEDRQFWIDCNSD